MKIRAVIIDDENLARARLKRMLSDYENIKIAGEAENGKEGIVLINDECPDVIFLDINMPGLSGFEMLDRLEKSPYVIFTTAYDRYALQAFEENTIDYLLKPISDKNLKRAVSKLEKFLHSGDRQEVNLRQLLGSIAKTREIIKRFSVKLGDRIFLIPDEDIFYFNAEDKHTFINTAEKSYIISFTLKELESMLDPEKFIRVHRAYIINIETVKSIHQWYGGKLLVKLKNGREITVSLNYINNFKTKINL